MSVQLRAGESTLKAGSDRVLAARADTESISNQLEALLAEVAGQWRGRGGDSFQHLMNRWNEKQRQMLDALTAFATALSATDQDNVATDEAQQAANAKSLGIADSIETRLGPPVL